MRSSNFTSIILSFVATLAVSCTCANADGNSNALTPQIASMETRFFSQTYPNETTEKRVERLEKEVFGQTKTGSLESRVLALGAAVLDPSLDTPSKHAKPEVTTSQPKLQAEPLPQETVPTVQSTPAQSTPTVQSKPAHSPGDYPTVTKLEQQILGHTYPDDDIKVRLSRLEQKAFGAVSSTNDLAGRVEALSQYAKFFDGSTPQQTVQSSPINEPQNNYEPQNTYRKPDYTPSYTPGTNLPHRSAYDVGGEEEEVRRPTAPAHNEPDRRTPERREVTRRPTRSSAQSTDAMIERGLEHDQPDKNSNYFRYVKKTVEHD